MDVYQIFVKDRYFFGLEQVGHTTAPLRVRGSGGLGGRVRVGVRVKVRVRG